MFTTRTGNFPIGLRRGWSDWQKDLSALIAWALDNQFAGIDLGRSFADVAPVISAGLKVGSIDLLEWHALMSPDAAKRAEAVAKNKEFIEGAAKAGATKFFAVLLPEDSALPRTENFAYAVESLKALVPTLEANGAQIVIEGYPGAGALACTPEGYRALFNEIPSNSIGINYDPSHLIRMGIDPIRFLKEFVSRVGHVHGKDCEILADDLYEYGWEQPATFKKSPDFGSAAWRYTIPGQGNSNWGEIFRILEANGYQGAIGIELEDRDYNGTEAGEKAGLLNSASFLSAA
jgi:sugar phosphate isomerase/epimerase